MARIGRVPHLPDEVIEEILVKLPAKTLIQFMLVSRGWYTLISSARFRNKHFHRQSNFTYPLVCWTGELSADPCNLCYFSVYLFPNEEVETRVELGLGDIPGVVTALCGPCDGIICVCFESHHLCLYNPTTRKSWPVRFDTEPVTHTTFSFWMEPLKNEFKIFIVDDYVLENGDIRHEFLVYSSSNDSWKCFQGQEALLQPDDYVPSNQCFSYTVSKGFYYFVKVRGATSDYLLTAFDICNDLFQEVLMPKIESSAHQIHLGLCDYSLAIFSIERAEWRCVGIWSMKEKGCWTKLFNVTELGYVENPLGFWKSNELFGLSYPEDELKVYDIVSRKTRELEVEATSGYINVQFYALCYKESLVSPKVKGQTMQCGA